MNKIYAPFTPQQVEALNAFQKLPLAHPFTCGSGNRKDDAHLDGEGVLVATESGWVCPFCNYKQDWVHAGMSNGAWANTFNAAIVPPSQA